MNLILFLIVGVTSKKMQKLHLELSLIVSQQATFPYHPHRSFLVFSRCLYHHIFKCMQLEALSVQIPHVVSQNLSQKVYCMQQSPSFLLFSFQLMREEQHQENKHYKLHLIIIRGIPLFTKKKTNGNELRFRITHTLIFFYKVIRFLFSLISLFVENLVPTVRDVELEATWVPL